MVTVKHELTSMLRLYAHCLPCWQLPLTVFWDHDGNLCGHFLCYCMRQKTHFNKSVHSRTLAITLRGGHKSTTGVRNLNLRSSQVIKRGMIGLNQPHSEHTFCFPLFNSVSIRKLLCRNVSKGLVSCFPLHLQVSSIPV